MAEEGGGDVTVTLSLDEPAESEPAAANEFVIEAPVEEAEAATELTFTLDAPAEDVDISGIVPEPVPDEPVTVELSLSDAVLNSNEEAPSVVSAEVDIGGIVLEPVPDEPVNAEITLPEEAPAPVLLEPVEVPNEVEPEKPTEPVVKDEVPKFEPEPVVEPEPAVTVEVPEPKPEPVAKEEPAIAEVLIPEPVKVPEPEPEVVSAPEVVPEPEPLAKEEPPAIVEVPVPEPVKVPEPEPEVVPAPEVVPEPEPVVVAEAAPAEVLVPEEPKPEPVVVEVPPPELAPPAAEPVAVVEPTPTVVAEAPPAEPAVVIPEPEPEPAKPELTAAPAPLSVQIDEEPEDFVDASALSPPAKSPVASVEKKEPVPATPPPQPEPIVVEEKAPPVVEAKVEKVEEKAPPPKEKEVLSPKTSLKTPLEKKSSLKNSFSNKTPTLEKKSSFEEKAKAASKSSAIVAENLQKKEEQSPVVKAPASIPAEISKKEEDKMATIAVDLGDIDDAPIEVVVPAPAPAPAPVVAAPSPSKTIPLSVSVGDVVVGDEFRTPVSTGSKTTKSISFAASASSSSTELPLAVHSASYTPPHFSLISAAGDAVSPKSPAPQAFVPPNMDETLRDTYMEHVTYYTNRILPFTQSAKSLVSRQSTLLDRLHTMRGEMEKAERELDLAIDEFDVLKRSTRNRSRRLMMAEEMGAMEDSNVLASVEVGADDEPLDGGLLVASSNQVTPSPYRSAFRRSRSSAVERSSWYTPRSPSARAYLEESDPEPTRYKFRSSNVTSSYGGSYLRSKYSSAAAAALEDEPIMSVPSVSYRSKFADEDQQIDAGAGGFDLMDGEAPSFSYTSSLGRYSSAYGNRAKVGENDEDLLKSTRRFEETLRTLRTTYTSLGPAVDGDLMVPSRSSKFSTTFTTAI